MDTFFNPKGIAVFGVSPSPKNVARAILQNLIGNRFQGTLVGIGSKKSSWSGVTIYPSIFDVPDPIDLAVIVTRATTVIPVLEDCHKRRIRRAIVMTAGFKELKGSIDALSDELLQASHRLGIRFIGPNCQGVINPHCGLCLPFGLMPPDKLKAGDISVLSQSGTVAWLTSFYLSHELAGVNKVVSMGNKMNVDEVDLVRYLLTDDTTSMIILHLESTERGRELFEILAQSSKPVILYKTQVSSESSAVAFSHTAALADDDVIVEGAAAQCGVMRAHSFRELIEMAKALSLEPIRGHRLGIIAASGGIGIAAADTCKKTRMELADLPQACLDKISSLPKTKIINLTNPVDTGNIYSSSDNFRALQMIMKVDTVDGAVLSQFHAGTGDYFEQIPAHQTIQEIARFSRKTGKPIALQFLCDPQTREEIKAQTSYPVFDTVEDAVQSMRYLVDAHLFKQRRRHRQEPLNAKSRAPFSFSSTAPLDMQGFELLSSYDIPCEMPLCGDNETALLDKARSLGFPVALKALSPDFTHKRSQGAVKLDLTSRDEVRSAMEQMQGTMQMKGFRVTTFLVQKMAPPGAELIFGGKRDPHYGPVVLLGWGGTDVENQEKLICYMAPVSTGMAEDMLTSLGGLFEQKSSYRRSLAEALSRFSHLLVDNPRIAEIDLNPVRLLPEKEAFAVLDSRIMLKKL